jgi:hypothetical protein
MAGVPPHRLIAEATHWEGRPSPADSVASALQNLVDPLAQAADMNVQLILAACPDRIDA